MKTNILIKIVSLTIAVLSVSCNDLDLVQQDAANSENWYQNEEQFRQSLNEGYRTTFFPVDGYEGAYSPGWDDDTHFRNRVGTITGGTVDSEFWVAETNWSNVYRGINRMITVLEEVKAQDGKLSEIKAEQFEAEAKFLLGVYWSYLITHYGDVPFFETSIPVKESFTISRTDKNVILAKVYDYFDFSSEYLPDSYDGLTYATKGAALAYKARVAIYMGDNATAAVAAKACMDLKVYELHPDFASLFVSSNKSSKEIIFKVPRSIDLLSSVNTNYMYYHMPRNNSGWSSYSPSWQLLAAFECVDGLPIDESPMFDPKNPFKNRDPRLLETIIPFGSLIDGDGLPADTGSVFLKKEYNPHPGHTKIMNYETGALQTNKDTRVANTNSSWNGLLWKKGIDDDWIDFQADNDKILMRYADVLLMYAESKIELGEIDATVLKAINDVRGRAYASSAFTNPAVTTTDQDKLRYIVRNERRSEFAYEGLRYMDLIRWRLADVILDGFKVYGLPETSKIKDDLKNDSFDDYWFWGVKPELDENGVANFDALVEAGFARQLTSFTFPERQYLFPIPANERRLNENLSQNEDY